MKVQYIGMFEAVIVAEWVDPQTGYSHEVARGESVDIPDEIAERLLEQPANWRRASGGKVPDYDPNRGAEPPSEPEPEPTATNPEG